MSDHIPYFSIIIPVYNAAATLQCSLDSLDAQSFKDFEVIFVNDCSSDGSAAILEEYTSAHDNARVITHERNRGAAAARNTGLDNARGHYLCWLDADDRMDSDELETIRDAGSDADIIGWDWTLSMTNAGRYMRQADYASPSEALTKLMCGVMRWNLWLWAVRRETWGGLRFIEGANMGEDMMAILSILSRASSVTQIHKSLYEYNAVNSASISKQFGPENRRQIEANLTCVQESLSSSPDWRSYSDKLNFLKLFLKLPLLQSRRFSDYRMWNEWLPEANKSATANPLIPFWTKIQQWMASKKIYAGLWLYYILIYKFVYGIIYR